MTRTIHTKAHHLSILVCVSFLILWLIPSTAYADGGAPNLAYVANTSRGVSVIDVAQQRVANAIAIKSETGMILLSIDARFLYVTQPQLGKVVFIAAKTGQTICTADVPGQPSLLAMDKNAGTIYAAGNEGSTVSALDPTNCSIQRTFQADGPIHGLGVASVSSANSTSNQLWVSTERALDIFDESNGQKLGNIAIAAGPAYIAIPPGNSAYVTTRQGSVIAVGLSNHAQVTLITGGQYGPMDYDEITGEIYVPDRQHNQLAVLTPVNIGFTIPREPNRTLKLSAPPAAIAITSDGQLGFAALQDGHVAMLDVPGRQTITTYTVGGDPHFIITGLYPPALGTTPQQANILSVVLNIAAYAFVIALLIIPLLLFRKFSKDQTKEKERQAQQAEKPEEQHEDSKPL